MLQRMQAYRGHPAQQAGAFSFVPLSEFVGRPSWTKSGYLNHNKMLDLVQDGRPTNSLRGTNEKAPNIIYTK